MVNAAARATSSSTLWLPSASVIALRWNPPRTFQRGDAQCDGFELRGLQGIFQRGQMAAGMAIRVACCSPEAERKRECAMNRFSWPE